MIYSTPYGVVYRMNPGGFLGLGIDGGGLGVDPGGTRLVIRSSGNTSSGHIFKAQVIGGTDRFNIRNDGILELYNLNGTNPPGVTNGIIMFAQDVASSSELRVKDEAGNTTTLSPHNFSGIPEGASDPLAWSYYSESDKENQTINVDMLKAIKTIEKLSGEKLVHVSDRDTGNQIDHQPTDRSMKDEIADLKKLILEQQRQIDELKKALAK